MNDNVIRIGILCLAFLASAIGMGSRELDAEQLLATDDNMMKSPDDDAFLSKTPGARLCWVADSCACPRVYGSIEVLFLQRTNGSFDQPVFLRTDAGTPVETVMLTSDLDFDFDPALRVVVGRRLHHGWAIEGSYLGLFDASDSAFLTASPEDPPRPVTFPGGLGTGNVFADVHRAAVNYSSALHSAELNLFSCRGYQRCCEFDKSGCAGKHGGVAGHLPYRTFEWFAGFRYLSLNERFRIDAERDQVPIGGGPLVTESGVYNIQSRNNLYGPQLGVRLRRWGERLGYEATGKAGIFGNDAKQRQFVIDFPDFELRPIRDSVGATGGDVAFVGELNISGLYRLTDVWNLRAGYNLMWITGVALAPDQLDFSGELPAGNQLSSSGSVFLHGVSGGLEARW